MEKQGAQDSMEKQKIVLELISKRLDSQIQSVDSFNTKAGLVLATCGVALAGYLQLLSSDRWIHAGEPILFIAEVALILLAGTYSFMSLVPGEGQRKWRYNPQPKYLADTYKALKEDMDFSQIIDSMVSAEEWNNKIYREKFESLSRARLAMFASGLVFFIHLLTFFSII